MSMLIKTSSFKAQFCRISHHQVTTQQGDKFCQVSVLKSCDCYESSSTGVIANLLVEKRVLQFHHILIILKGIA